MVAGVGLEPHDLRVMSPTSCQLLYPAISDWKKWCRTPGSNRYGKLIPQDFKSWASAYSATPAHSRFSIAQLLYHVRFFLSIPLKELFCFYCFCTIKNTFRQNKSTRRSEKRRACLYFISSGFFFTEREILFFSGSTDRTVTFTTSPTESTSEGCFIYLFEISDM